MAGKKSAAAKSAQNSSAVYSMTGFGKGSACNEKVTVEVELRSINSRFLDLTLRVPRSYYPLEQWFREVLSARLYRGRVDLVINRKVVSSDESSVQFNQPLYDAYRKLYESLLPKDTRANQEIMAQVTMTLLDRKEILEALEEVVDFESEKAIIESALDAALNGVCAMREQEGKRLGMDLQHRLSNLRGYRDSIEALAPANTGAVIQRLNERLKKISAEIALDPVRLHAEAALLADKMDVSEELVRLRSHYDQFDGVFRERPQGRKIEFVLQEIGREFNTIGSKAQDPQISALIVEAKAEIERIREQVQNIE